MTPQGRRRWFGHFVSTTLLISIVLRCWTNPIHRAVAAAWILFPTTTTTNSLQKSLLSYPSVHLWSPPTSWSSQPRRRRRHHSLSQSKNDEPYNDTASTSTDQNGVDVIDDDAHDESGSAATLTATSFRERYGHQLPDWLIDKCEHCGWIHPTRIQQKVLDAVLLTSPRNDSVDTDCNDTSAAVDCIVQAETGSGKTLAYLLPGLAQIQPDRQAVQMLIVVPTRELGLQVARVAKRLCAGNTNITVMSVLQGSRNQRQRAWAWSEPPQVVIGTVPELSNMIRLGGLKRYNSIRFLVVDEVDACLQLGGGQSAALFDAAAGIASSATPLHELLSKYLSPTFDDGKDEDDIAVSDTTSTGKKPKKNRRPLHPRQTIFCSATIPQHRHFLKQCVQNQWMTSSLPPKYIGLQSSSAPQPLPAQLRHAYWVCAHTSTKLAVLRRLLQKIQRADRNAKVIVFADTQRPLEEMANVIAMDLHGVYWNEAKAATPPSDYSATVPLVSVLRSQDSLSERAVAVDAFRGEATTSHRRTTIPPRVSTTSVHDNENDDNSNTAIATTTTTAPQQFRVLLSTDLAARGLDYLDTTHVVQVDLPDTVERYIHRAGRTARLGRLGQVVSLVTPQQEFVIQRFANQLVLFDQFQCIGRQKEQSTEGSAGLSNKRKRG